MNFFKYIGITKERFIEDYLHTGLVTEGVHKTLPLNIFAYGRKAVHENVWDAVTSKCRGIVVDRNTEEVIARPFEKFHNYGSTVVEGLTPESNSIFGTQPVVWEKMDGFMVTAFFYAGEWHAASKTSFHSIHAKWATAELRRKMPNPPLPGSTVKTFMFEGLHPDLRIVVNYDTPAELVLLTVIDNETGTEHSPDELRAISDVLDFNVPDQILRTWQDVADQTGTVNNSYDEEGYVLTWYRPGTTPFRLKMKYIDYLRLHRMVTGVSPKRIWEVLALEQTFELQEYLNNSTPWFSEFVKKWMRVMTNEYQALLHEANNAYDAAKETVRVKVGQTPYANMGEERKSWAAEFTRPENEKVSSICFAMLDNKDVRPVIWKKVKHVTAGVNPMVDSHSL